ncbi:MAG TPA: glycosyltransferase family 2 protein [Gammaproteobacteria bacterium]|jgi:glycosyltransferase involved in cell wall biosynthesis|nr:glycosyltransferase family 2 protein [Gammaproteobacteria bacterium]
MSGSKTHLSIVLPAKDEAQSLAALLPKLRGLYPEAEIVVVDDGSKDGTADVTRQAGALVVRHPYSLGNGAAVKSGARAAHGQVLVFLDADGQHPPEDIARLLDLYDKGYDMVVGARTGATQATFGRHAANTVYNLLASWMVGNEIADLTSGFRVVHSDLFKEYLHLLPNRFSYPTTITMAFFRAGYRVGYVPIEAGKRQGQSHIRPLRDGTRFLMIIFKVGTLYSPLKIFLPISFSFFMTSACYYLYTYLTEHRFTNMSALLFITSVLIFLIGLVSEQITNLLFANTSHR